MTLTHGLEIAVAILLVILFRDRIVFALAVLFLPKSWVRESLTKVFGKDGET